MSDLDVNESHVAGNELESVVLDESTAVTENVVEMSDSDVNKVDREPIPMADFISDVTGEEAMDIGETSVITGVTSEEVVISDQTEMDNGTNLEESQNSIPDENLPSEDSIKIKGDAMNGPIISLSPNNVNSNFTKFVIKKSNVPSVKTVIKSDFKESLTSFVVDSASKNIHIQNLAGHIGESFELPFYTVGSLNELQAALSQKSILNGNKDSGTMLTTDNKLTGLIIPKIRRKKEEDEIPEFLSDELKHAYRIVRELISDKCKTSNWPFMDAISETWPEIRDYGDVIKQPMWLKKIRNNLLEKKYASITEPIADLRLILENCYRYNGPDNSISKRALKLETILEQKLALLPKELKEKTSIEVTSGEFFDEQNGNTSKKKTYSTLVEGGHSLLLERVKHERSQREKEFKRKLMEEKKAEKEAAYRKAVDWENTLLNQDNISAMKAMWELPQIGHFLYLTQLTLNIPEVSQFELERMMLMPRQSSLLPTIMTSLLANPNGRSNLDKRPPMKYRIWQEKLKQRVMKWYQLLRSKNNSPLAVFERYGIEPNFFSVMGLVNPLEEGQFHELNFHQRVWLLKSLCDYCLNTHKTIQEVISEQSIVDQKEVILGSDIRGNIYIHFPQFCGQDLRIYRQVGWVPPSIDFSLANGKQKAPVIRTVRKPPEPIKKELANDDATTPGSHRRPSHLRQKLKAVKRQDMICENPRGDVYESMEVDESNPEGDSLSGDVSLSPVKNNENDAKPLPSEVPEDSLDDRVDVDAVARECDEDASDASCSKLAKGGKNKRPETPPINTNLSEAIIQFDLEKELAISIRGRCSRPRDGSSGDDKNDDKKKSRKRFKADDESGCEDVVSEDDGFHGDNEKIKIEEEETGRVKSEDNSDDESGPKVKEELKNEEEEEEETIDRKMFDIKIEDYLPSDTYEPPDLNKFELVVDSMESLKELIDGLLKEEDVVNANKEKAGRSKVPRLSRIQKNEIELRNRLRNLRVELDPWKDKLIQAVKRTLQRLKKEWDDYDPKSEELTGVDLWESDSDDEKGNDDNKTVKSSSDEELDGAESGRIKTRYLKAKNKLKRKAERESGEAKVEPVTVSSRGRVRKSLLKKDGIYEYGEDNVASKDVDGSDNFKPDDKKKCKKEARTSQQVELLMNHSNQNTSSKAKERFEWEKLKQSLLAANKEDGGDRPRQVIAISKDTLLKKVSFNDAYGNPIIKGKAGNTSGGNQAGVPRIVNVGGKMIILPSKDGGGGKSETFKVMNIGGKTVLVRSKCNSDAENVGAVKSILPKLATGTSAGDPKSNAMASLDSMPVVPLHTASGGLQKILSLSDAQKLLNANKNSTIQAASNNLQRSADGSVMVPVVDGDGKVCYLKMKKTVNENDSALKEQLLRSVPTEHQHAKKKRSQGKRRHKEETGKSILFTPADDSKGNSSQAFAKIISEQQINAAGKLVARSVPRIVTLSSESVRNAQQTDNPTESIQSSVARKNIVTSFPIGQLSRKDGIFNIVNSQGQKVLVRLSQTGTVQNDGKRHVILTSSSGPSVVSTVPKPPTVSTAQQFFVNSSSTYSIASPSVVSVPVANHLTTVVPSNIQSASPMSVETVSPLKVTLPPGVKVLQIPQPSVAKQNYVVQTASPLNQTVISPVVSPTKPTVIKPAKPNTQTFIIRNVANQTIVVSNPVTMQQSVSSTSTTKASSPSANVIVSSSGQIFNAQPFQVVQTPAAQQLFTPANSASSPNHFILPAGSVTKSVPQTNVLQPNLNTAATGLASNVKILQAAGNSSVGKVVMLPSGSNQQALKVIKNKSGGQVIPMALSSQQLAGLSPGGSYILNTNTGKLVPAAAPVGQMKVVQTAGNNVGADQSAVIDSTNDA